MIRAADLQFLLDLAKHLAQGHMTDDAQKLLRLVRRMNKEINSSAVKTALKETQECVDDWIEAEKDQG